MQKNGYSLASEIKLAKQGFDDIVIDTGGRDSKDANIKMKRLKMSLIHFIENLNQV